jgi:GAF domain-containing protein/signal transduction histidine kinase
MDSKSQIKNASRLPFAMDVVDIALRDQDPSFRRALYRIVEEYNSFGCIIWELFDPTELDRSYSGSRLYTLASRFPTGKILSMCDLPVNGTISGRAIQEKRTISCVDVKRDGGPRKDHPFLKVNNIGPIVSVFIKFFDGKTGTFDLHRTEEQGQFTENEINEIELIARQLPNLYRCRRERLTLEVVQDVNSLVDKVVWSNTHSKLKKTTNECLQRICKTIAKVFGALEVTVVLNDRIASTGRFQVRATTWDGTLHDRNLAYVIDDNTQKETDHKTEWVIRNKKPMLLFDLCDAEPEEAAKRYQHLRLTKNDEFNREAIQRIKNHQRQRQSSSLETGEEAELTEDDEDSKPPISYIAVPIPYEDHTLGVLRCCGTTKNPHYFSRRDVLTLELLASKIGQYWATFIQVTEQQTQLDATKLVVNGVAQAIGVVQQHITTERPNFDLIIPEMLKISANSLPDANVIELWKVKAEGGPVAFAGRHPQSTDTDLQLPVEARAEVALGKSIVGELRLCQSRSGAVSDQSRQHLKIFAAQFGLFHALIGEIENQRKLRGDVNERYQEITHQLYGPLIQARDRADWIFRQMRHGESMKLKDVEYAALRGLCRKALGVMRVLKVDTEGSDKLNLRPKQIKHDRAFTVVTTILNEAAYDFEFQFPRSNIVFDIDRRSFFQAIGARPVIFDRELLEQVVYCIFENAMKYSRKNSKVIVTANKFAKELCIETANHGLVLSPSDAEECVKRNWRSESAKIVTDSGKGLGLWLCSEILNSLGGRLQVLPTDSSNLTRVRIYLPL